MLAQNNKLIYAFIFFFFMFLCLYFVLFNLSLGNLFPRRYLVYALQAAVLDYVY